MTNKNQKIYSTDPEFLKNLADEQQNYIGRGFKLDLENGLITIFALPQRKPRVKRDKDDRDKRKEKFERRA